MEQAAATFTGDGIARLAQIKDHRPIFDDDRILGLAEKHGQLAFELGGLHEVQEHTTAIKTSSPQRHTDTENCVIGDLRIDCFHESANDKSPSHSIPSAVTKGFDQK
jgi:hypothetical protein